MDRTTWLWLGTLTFALGFIGLLAMGWRRRTRDEESHWLIHLFVVLTAFTSYLIMASGGGRLLTDGREVFFIRYVDWAVTTPLLLLGLSLTALHTPFRRWALVLGLLFTDVYMILTGLLADLSPSGSAIKWTWYLVSSGAFLFLYLCLWGAMQREAGKTGGLADNVYRRNLTFLSIVWAFYPFNFLFGPEGLKLLDPTASIAIYAVLDVAAKVIFGFYSFANTRARTTAELMEGEVPAHDLRPSPEAHHELWAPGRTEAAEPRMAEEAR